MKSLLVLLLITATSASLYAQASIELILDASGSMNAPISGKESRLQAARKAVEAFLPTVPENASLAFRAYGHQSPRAKHDCNDTALIVPFTNAAKARAAVLQTLPSLKAQGYTPITKVIELAAKDLGATSTKQRLIILVSDGKETCDGDPCAMARALEEANAELVIHTVGFGVDTAAMSELKCVAAVTGGTYFDANDAGQLSTALRQAVTTAPKIPPAKKDGRGKLKINNAGAHDVLDAAGKKIGSINRVTTEIPLAAGTYSVTFGDQLWRGIEVQNGKTTVLEAALIHVSPVKGSVKIVDPETGAVRASLDEMNTRATLLPGTYTLKFGEMEVPFIRAEGGKPVEIQTGMIVVDVTGLQNGYVQDAAGRRIRSVDAMNRRVAVPAGSYIVVSGGKKLPVTVKSGEEVTIKP